MTLLLTVPLKIINLLLYIIVFIVIVFIVLLKHSLLCLFVGLCVCVFLFVLFAIFLFFKVFYYCYHTLSTFMSSRLHHLPHLQEVLYSSSLSLRERTSVLFLVFFSCLCVVFLYDICLLRHR